MGRWLTAVACFLLTSSFLNANVDIPQEHWVKNRPGGFCFYSAVETIGRWQNNPQLKGLVDHYAQWPSVGADSKDAHACFRALGVPYHVHENQTMSWLKKQVDDGVPVVCGLWWVHDYHAVVVVDVDEKWVKIIDSNRVDKGYIWINREWWEWAWAGWCVTVGK